MTTGATGSDSHVDLIFIPFIVLVVALALGATAYAIAAWLRHEQMHPEGDKVQGGPQRPRPRPEHLRVENEQPAHLADGR